MGRMALNSLFFIAATIIGELKMNIFVLMCR